VNFHILEVHFWRVRFF